MPGNNKPRGREEDDNKTSSRRGRREEEDNDDGDRGSRGRSGKKNGWALWQEKQEEAEERKEARENEPREFFLTSEHDTAVIQILDPEPFIFDGHSIKTKDGKFKFEPCQLAAQKTCLMCNDNLRSSHRPALRVLDFRGEFDYNKNRFKGGAPKEKVWIPTNGVLALLAARMRKKKLSDLENWVVEISRSGTNKATAYAFDDAFDKEGDPIEPLKHKPTLPELDELMAPRSNKELIALGFEKSGD